MEMPLAAVPGDNPVEDKKDLGDTELEKVLERALTPLPKRRN